MAVRDFEAARGLLNGIDTNRLSSWEKSRYYALFAKSLSAEHQDGASYDYFLRAKKGFLSLDSARHVAMVNMEIVELLMGASSETLDYRPFLDELLHYAEQSGDDDLLIKTYMQAGRALVESQPDGTLDYFRKARKLTLKNADSLYMAKINHNIGVVMAEKTPYLDSALYYYDLAGTEYEKQGITDYVFYILHNKAVVHKKLGNYDMAIRSYLKADSLTLQEFHLGNKKNLYESLADAYEQNHDYRNATRYWKLFLAYSDSVDQENQNASILDLQTKYQTAEQVRKNLELSRRQIVLILGMVLLLLLLIISFLAYRHQRSKKKFAEAKNEIERQKVEKLLKEQEINGIDAMIEGQEKERQRIANDLHDNLGSLMATLKLHFQNLNIRTERLRNDQVELLQKTDALIEEAYQQVRGMAHARNAGLKSREGLLPAVKNFATKASIANKLVIEVEDHGLDRRLENSLEITIFRMIQELITNVIKHSEATECTIHITQHESELNILVEDNGVGFEVNRIPSGKGMGLFSIRKRVESLGGTMVIESVPKSGTSVIIEISLP